MVLFFLMLENLWVQHYNKFTKQRGSITIAAKYNLRFFIAI